jgi:dipeptidyl aminopeptidase/acylaminoacyl peptidase
MRRFTVGILLILQFSMWMNSAALAQTMDEGPQAQFLTETHCFGALDQSYDDWMAFLKAKSEPLEYLKLRYKFPRALYEHYRHTLDCSAVTYSSDGYVVRGWIVQPKAQGRAKLPVIVYNRKGHRALYPLTFAELFGRVFPLAERGYLVAASQYRGTIPVPDEASSPDQFGGDDVRDVTRLMRIVAGMPQVNRGNFFMIGEGRGAIMAFRALDDSPVPIRAIAIYSGIYDLHDLLRFRPDLEGVFRDQIPGYPGRAQVELDKRSVNRWVAKLPPNIGILVIHGEADEQEPPVSAHAFVERLKALDRPHKAVFYEGDTDSLARQIEEIHAETLAWFRRFREQPSAKKPIGAGRS